MAYKSSPRGSRPVNLVALHTAEGARTAASLGAYFWRADIQASSHVGIDASNTMQYVPYERAAWTLRSGNPISDNAEMCAFAGFTRAEWLSTGTVRGCVNPRAILDRAAAWARSRCLARGIPMRKITPADVAAGRPGIIAHWDWTIGMRDGSHTDPGANFPWDYFIQKVNEGGGSAPLPIIPEEIMQLAEPHWLPNSQTHPEKDEDGWVSHAAAVEVGKLSAGGNSTVVAAMWFNLTSCDFGDPDGSTEYALWIGNDAGNMVKFGGGSSDAEGTLANGKAMKGNAFRQFVFPIGTRHFTLRYRNHGKARAGYSFPMRAQ